MPTTVTKTLKSTGGDYVSFAAWQAAQAGDITTAGSDEVHVLDCYEGTTTTGGWQADGSLSEQVDITGWTTDATNYVTIKAASGEGHGGVLGSGFRIAIDIGATTGTIFRIRESYTQLIDLEIQNTRADFQGRVVYIEATYTTVNRCIIINDSTSAAASYSVDNAQSYCVVRNCLVIQDSSGTAIGIKGTNFRPGQIFDNCTVINGNVGIASSASGADTLVRNCVAVTDGTDFDENNYDASSSNNASGDTTVSTLSIGSVTGVVLTDGTDFTEPSTGDYTPTSTGKLYEAGADLSGTFTDDIAGNTRG